MAASGWIPGWTFLNRLNAILTLVSSSLWRTDPSGPYSSDYWHLHGAFGSIDRGMKFGLFILWFTLVIFMAWHHTFWRDEVRALSLALEGDSFVEMLTSLHGEGHPAVWYLLL